MKKVLPRITLLLAVIIFSLTLIAQEHPKKQSSKELAEKGSRADLIIGKREQRKSLEGPPLKINKPDSVATVQKKPAHKSHKNPKIK